MKTLKTKAPPGRRGRCRGSGLISAGSTGAAWVLLKITHKYNDVSIFFIVVVYLYIVNVTYREFIEVHYTYVLIESIYK